MLQRFTLASATRAGRCDTGQGRGPTFSTRPEPRPLARHRLLWSRKRACTLDSGPLTQPALRLLLRVRLRVSTRVGVAARQRACLRGLVLPHRGPFGRSQRVCRRSAGGWPWWLGWAAWLAGRRAKNRCCFVVAAGRPNQGSKRCAEAATGLCGERRRQTGERIAPTTKKASSAICRGKLTLCRCPSGQASMTSSRN